MCSPIKFVLFPWPAQMSQACCDESFQEPTDAVKYQKPYSLWCQVSNTICTIKNSSVHKRVTLDMTGKVSYKDKTEVAGESHF